MQQGRRLSNSFGVVEEKYCHFDRILLLQRVVVLLLLCLNLNTLSEMASTHPLLLKISFKSFLGLLPGIIVHVLNDLLDSVNFKLVLLINFRFFFLICFSIFFI